MKLISILSIIISNSIFCQELQGEIKVNNNSLCDCDYNGPSILINQISVKPSVGNGSIYGGGQDLKGEWIELFNPDKCDSVNISKYILGSYNSYIGKGMAFTLPENTIVPPLGFVIVRGSNAPIPPTNCIDIIVSNSNNSICIGDGLNSKIWFQDAGGWFAFYNAQGEPQDVIKWGNPPQIDLNSHPCLPPNNILPTNTTQLASANSSNICYNLGDCLISETFARIPDGGSWSNTKINEGPNLTYGSCNVPGGCVLPAACNGNATIEITNGQPPFTYTWNDSENQTTQTASNLCAGNYSVVVTDANGKSKTFNTEIIDHFFNYALEKNNTTCDISNGKIKIEPETNDVYTYKWIPNVSTSNSALNLTSGSYEITIDNGHCDQDTIIEILPSSSIQKVNFKTEDLSCEHFGQLKIESIDGGIPTYFFSIDNKNYIENKEIEIDKSGTYILTIKDKFNCTLDTNFTINELNLNKSIFIPNCFSPNNDNVNSTWNIKGECIENIHCEIVNRWGQKIIELNSVSDYWDGKLNGETLPDGVYYYKIEYNYYHSTHELVSGYITLFGK